MSANRPNGLTPEQETAIVALLNQPTVQKAAEQVGVSDRTVYRWMDEPEFSEAYRRARRQAFSQAIAMSQKYAPLALQALAKIVHDDSRPCSARVSAASAILKFSRESLELDDLAARLAALERRMAEAVSGRPRMVHEEMLAVTAA